MVHPSSARRGYCDCRYGQLHYLHAGTSDSGRPPLVLLHQNPSSSEEYRALLEAMATDRAVFAFDTPGYGMSDGPDGPRAIADYCAAFAEGIEALGIGKDRPINLFGFHTGALLAVELAAQLGPRAGRIALAGIPYRSPAERQERLDQIHAVQPPTEDGDAIFARLRWLWSFLVTQRAAGVPIDRAAHMFMERAKPLHRYWWAYEGVWTYPIEDRLRAVAHETLVLLPDEMLYEHSIAAARMIPRARTLELPTLTRDIFEPEGGCAIVADALRSFFI
jgi:pimeloyl-ACP methyl ester carboxylesterase